MKKYIKRYLRCNNNNSEQILTILNLRLGNDISTVYDKYFYTKNNKKNRFILEKEDVEKYLIILCIDFL